MPCMKEGEGGTHLVKEMLDETCLKLIFENDIFLSHVSISAPLFQRFDRIYSARSVKVQDNKMSALMTAYSVPAFHSSSVNMKRVLLW